MLQLWIQENKRINIYTAYQLPNYQIVTYYIHLSGVHRPSSARQLSPALLSSCCQRLYECFFLIVPSYFPLLDCTRFFHIKTAHFFIFGFQASLLLSSLYSYRKRIFCVFPSNNISFIMMGSFTPTQQHTGGVQHFSSVFCVQRGLYIVSALHSSLLSVLFSSGHSFLQPLYYLFFNQRHIQLLFLFLIQ